MNNKNNVTNEAFEELFQVTTMEKLYPGSPEGNMFVLVSSMSASEICEAYAAAIDDYRPFVIIPPEAMEFIKDSEREEWRQERAIKRHIIPQEYNDDLEIEDQGSNPATICENAELRNKLRKALDALNPKQRKRIELRYFEGMTIEKMAQVEGVSTKTIRESLEYAIIKLKKFF